MKFYVSNGSSYVIVSDTVAFSSYDGWVHVDAVIDNSTAKLYMNGELKHLPLLLLLTQQELCLFQSVRITPTNLTVLKDIFLTLGFINLRCIVAVVLMYLRQLTGKMLHFFAHYGNNISFSFQNHGSPTYPDLLDTFQFHPLVKMQ